MANAQLNGTLTDDGGLPCDIRFEWGITPAMGNYTPWNTPFVTGDTFSATIIVPGGLNTIYFRAIARNALGTTLGTTLTFVTPGQAPIVITVAANNIGMTEGQLNGAIINDGGGGCETKFEYGGTSDYGNDTDWVSGAVTGSTFNELLPSLAPNTSIHFRALARNGFGIDIGQDMVFTTRQHGANSSLITGDLILPLLAPS